MAHSLRSAGQPVQLPVSVAQAGKKPRTRGQRESSWLEESSTPALLRKLTGYLGEMSKASSTACAAARVGHATPWAALASIEATLCDQAFEISARDVVRELAKRVRNGGQHA